MTYICLICLCIVYHTHIYSNTHIEIETAACESDSRCIQTSRVIPLVEVSMTSNAILHSHSLRYLQGHMFLIYLSIELIPLLFHTVVH